MFEIPTPMIEIVLKEFAEDRLIKNKAEVSKCGAEIVQMIKDKYSNSTVDHRSVLAATYFAGLYLMDVLVTAGLDDAPDPIKKTLALLNLAFVDSLKGE